MDTQELKTNSAKNNKLQVAIATDSSISAEVGAVIAEQGGNAVDAAIATTLVSMCTSLGVMAPGASGFITIWAQDQDPIVIDAYAEIPGKGLNPQLARKKPQAVTFDYGGLTNTLIGYSSIATPGIFAGLEMAAREYGNLSWSELLNPVITILEEGFPLSKSAAEYLSYTHEAIFSWHPESYRTLHHQDGSYLREGEIVKIPDLAKTIRLIAQKGSQVFYTGELAQQIVKEIQANGGLLTLTDLAEYQAKKEIPIRFNFADWEIVTNPPPAIGGVCLAALLLLLDSKKDNNQTVNKMIATQKAVLDYRYNIDSEIPGLLKLGLKSPSTIHISTADTQGLACSITASAGYGSGVMISGTGLWLNNSLGEVELHPQGLDGLTWGTRLSSNMAPTIARHSDGTVLAIGSPGASRITTAIAQVLFNYLQLGMSLTEAISSPRLHVEIFQDQLTIAYEKNLVNQLIEGFITRQFPDLSMYFGGVQAVLNSPQFGLLAVADPRRQGGIAYSR
jgi:gamma-glutamyltranspeptidase/glutathione hydrolase